VDYLNLVWLPQAQGRIPTASAPLDQLALLALNVALAWLALAIVAWSCAGYWFLRRHRALR